jgi:hypothetical protein
MRRAILRVVVYLWCITYASAFQLPYFARQASLGDATVSDIGKLSGMFNNPAVVNSQEISFALTEWFYETRAGSVLASYNIKNWFFFAAGFNYLSYGQISSYDENGNFLGEFSPYSLSFKACITKQFYDKLSVGLGIQKVRELIYYKSSSECHFNLGLIYSRKFLNFGASLLGPKESTINTGISIKVFKDLLILSALSYDHAKELKAKLGVEYYWQKVAFRIGYNDGRFSIGIGYLPESGWVIDYALTNHKELGITNGFSVSIKKNP